MTRARAVAPPAAPPAATVAAGAALFAWPVIFNRYAIVFSDTGGFLEMGFEPSIGWDKPFVYGPLVAALSLGVSLILPVLAQAGLISALLWRLDRVWTRRPAAPWRHVLICAVLAAATPSAWFAATVMPDILAPVAVLALCLAAVRRGVAAVLVAALAIAAHLSHLIVAAAVIAALALLQRRVPWRPVLAFALAVGALLATNWVSYGRLAVSPYGSVFALARLVGDGPARTYLDRVCPAAGLILCPWRDRLTDDSDQFLWDPAGPFWADPAPLPAFAAEASRIVRDTILTEPLPVLRAAYRNTATQLIAIDAGDTLGSAYLAEAVRPRIARYLPGAELARFDASRQISGELPAIAHALNPLYRIALAAGALVCVVMLLRGLRRRSAAADLAAIVLIALAANALATGALSKPHDRYQARIAWLLLLPGLLALPGGGRLTPPQPPAPTAPEAGNRLPAPP